MWNYISALTHDLLHPQVHQELTTENLGDGSGDAASKVYVFKIVKGPIMFCHVKNIGESPILEFVENYTSAKEFEVSRWKEYQGAIAGSPLRKESPYISRWQYLRSSLMQIRFAGMEGTRPE
nr:hypothetical protein Iba_chr14bCG6560 [Ipomoea batatas]